MIFNRHSELDGSHAILSPSGYSWLNYENEEDFYRRFKSTYAQAIGTSIHALAKDLIENRIKLSDSDKKLVTVHLIQDGIPRSIIEPNDWFQTLKAYVNDAIGFRMTPEVPLVYSLNAFGTTDAISFRDDILRIHDLKTGITPAKMDQLLCYAAYFCLEYKVKPKDIQTNLRIYQKENVMVLDPEPDDISTIIDKTIAADKVISKFRED